MTTAYDAAPFPDGAIRADTFRNLGGLVTATGRMIVPTLLNQAQFTVGADGLWLTGNFNNQGGTLNLVGRLALDPGFSLTNSGTIVLSGPNSALIQNGVSVFGGDFGVPTGGAVEVRDRHIDGNSSLSYNGTLIVGSGSSFSRWGGSFTGPGEIHIGTGGTMWLGGNGYWGDGGAITIESGGALTIAGHDNGIHRFYNRVLTNNGTVTHEERHIGLNVNTTITNNSLWIDQSGFAFTVRDGQTGGGSFVNNGTFRKLGANEVAFDPGVNLVNNGVFDIQQGGIGLYGTGTLAGSTVVNMAAGTYFLIRDGEATIRSGARFNGGDVSFGDAGDTTLLGDIYVTHATFWGGALYGDHTLHGSWWTGANAWFGTPGTTTIASDGIWEFGGHNNGVNRLYDRSFVNNGLVNHTSSHIGMNTATTITNNALWVDSSGYAFTAADGRPGGGSFINHGTFRKTGANEVAFGGSMNFVNDGLIDVQAGGIGIYGTGTLAGSTVVNMATGTYVLIRDGTVTIASGTRFNGGDVGFGDAGKTTLSGDVYVNRASFWGGQLFGDHTLHGSWWTGGNAWFGTPGTTTIASDGIWEFGGHNNGINRIYDRTFINNGVINHTDSHLGMNVNSAITNNALWVESSNYSFTTSDGQAGGGTFVNSGTFRKEGATQVAFHSPVFTNTGTVDVTAGSLYFNTGRLANRVGNALVGGTWVLRDGTYLRDEAAALTNNQANLTFYGNAFYWGSALARNEGTLRLLGGHAFATTTAFTNTGTLEVGAGSSFSSTSTFANSGTLNVTGSFTAGTLTNTGTLAGSGSLHGNLLSSGTLAPGNSPGLLSVTGNLSLLNSSQLLIELGGTARGVTFDGIDVSGTLTLGGQLAVSLVDSFNPVSGASFALFNAGAITGGFDSVSLPALGPGLTWNTSGLSSTGVISVTASAVPEPSTYAAVAGVLALGWAAWRRRRGAGR
ncbi:MAG: PEP-CTERM sorting domain-containing protein [Verrucomicrobia bacterium]|nr:PEP-CTERM sorting domain-containing protein [Verrucomicrobiota bacterium]